MYDIQGKLKGMSRFQSPLILQLSTGNDWNTYSKKEGRHQFHVVVGK